MWLLVFFLFVWRLSTSYTKVIKRLVDLYTCWPVLYLPVGTVVQCSLHPLGGGCHQWVLDQTDQMSRQSTAPLTPHRITLIWHSTGTYNQRTESPEKPVSISSTCNLLALLSFFFQNQLNQNRIFNGQILIQVSFWIQLKLVHVGINHPIHLVQVVMHGNFFCEIQKHWSHWPIWSFSNGSSSSLKLANSLISVQIYKTWLQLKSMVFVKM